jgi:hypothetical protein
MSMTEREMFEKSFERPSNYFQLSSREQWDIDKELGILDWEGRDLTAEDRARFRAHYARSNRIARLKSFRRKNPWRSSEDPALWLLTPHELDQLPDGTEVESISGRKLIKGRDHIDDDTRGPYTAFGLRG